MTECQPLQALWEQAPTNPLCSACLSLFPGPHHCFWTPAPSWSPSIRGSLLYRSRGPVGACRDLLGSPPCACRTDSPPSTGPSDLSLGQSLSVRPWNWGHHPDLCRWAVTPAAHPAGPCLLVTAGSPGSPPQHLPPVSQPFCGHITSFPLRSVWPFFYTEIFHSSVLFLRERKQLGIWNLQATAHGLAHHREVRLLVSPPSFLSAFPSPGITH